MNWEIAEEQQEDKNKHIRPREQARRQNSCFANNLTNFDLHIRAFKLPKEKYQSFSLDTELMTVMFSNKTPDSYSVMTWNDIGKPKLLKNLSSLLSL